MTRKQRRKTAARRTLRRRLTAATRRRKRRLAVRQTARNAPSARLHAAILTARTASTKVSARRTARNNRL